jgi:DinB superfamily
MTAAERQERVQKLRDLPDAVDAAVNGLNDQQLDTPYRDGGWTVRQVVHHLADSHMNAFVRMKLMVTENHPTLKPYDQDAWAALPDSRKLPVRSSLAIIRGLHERWVILLESLPEDAWTRTALHPERGVVTMEGTLSTYANHGANHVRQITGLRQAKGW